MCPVKVKPKKRGLRFASKFEERKATLFSKEKIKWEYEAEAWPWQPPMRKYHPDFKITNKSGKVWFLELKGRFTSFDRTKMLHARNQHPEKDIRLMFQNASIRLNKTSKTTYGEWATKHNFKWCVESIPKEWLNE